MDTSVATMIGREIPGFFWLAGCDDGSDGADDAGGKIPANDSGPAESRRQDAGEAKPGDDAGSGSNIRPTTPPAPSAVRLMDAPCAFPASLSYEERTLTLLMACGGAQNALFRSSPVDSVGGGEWSVVGLANGYPSNHLKLSDRYYLVNHSMPDGFTIIDGSTGGASSTVDFSQLSIPDSSGNALGFAPNNPGGAVMAGGKICVATSNMDHIDMDPANTTFFIGTVLCFPYNGNGIVEPSNAIAYYTSGANPTGMALVDKEPANNGTQRFAVLSSNNYSPATGEVSTIDIIESSTMAQTPIFLGPITAQISPALATAEIGETVILYGVQKPAGAAAFAELEGVFVDSGRKALDYRLNEVAGFVSSVQTTGSIAAISDFGVFGEGGRILFTNINPGWFDVLETPLDGAAGPSVVAGNKLYQAVTDNTGASGSIVQVDLGGLE